MAAKKNINTSYSGPCCPFCNVVLTPTQIYSGSHTCNKCGGQFEAVAFQPQSKKIRVLNVAAAGVAGASPCANHSGNAAVANCERCGNFMCNLCSIDSDAMKLCPACFDRLTQEGALSTSNNRIRNYTGIAGSTAVGGCLFWPASFILGPMTIYFAVKALRQKREMGVTEGRWHAYLAMLIGLCSILFAGFIIFTLVARI
jgi:ribosomal protein L37AE/L43A